MRYAMTLGVLLVCAVGAASVAVAQQASAPAAPASDPYAVVVPVADTSADHRNQAFATALASILARTGDHAVPAAMLADASTYVQQYQYQQAPAGSAQPFQLVVRFAPAAIEHLERALAAPAPAATTAMPASGVPVPSPAGGGANLVWVSGIHSALDFAGTVAALDNVPGVDSVGVRMAQADGMLLAVHASVPLVRMVAALGAHGHLAPAAASHAGAAASLRWTR